MSRLGLVAAGLLLAAGPVWGQAEMRVSAAVRRPAADGDTVPIAGIRVVLHRIGITTQGPIDSLATDARGGLAFRFAVDTAANYLLSARYAGIEYFSAPIKPEPGRSEHLDLLVFDTSSTAPIRTRSRTLVVGAPETAGGRTVIDWVVLDNPGRQTRVGADSLASTWGAALPRDSRNPAVGDARLTPFSPEAVTFGPDSVRVTAPLAPGVKQLVLQYELPAGRDLDLTLDGIDSVDVYLEERNAKVEGAGWVRADSQNFQGRVFRRYVRRGAAPRLRVDFPGLELPTGAVLAALVGLLVAGLGAATVMALRRRPVAAPAGPGPTALADRIAALDRAFAAVEAPDAEATARYQRERGELMTALRAALAARGRRS